MLGTDVGVIHLDGLAQTQLKDFLGARGEGDVASRCRGAVTDDLLHLGTDCLQGNVKGLEGLGGNALALADEPEQQVLGTDVIVVQGLGLILGQDDDPAGPIGEPFEHELSSYVEQTNHRKTPVYGSTRGRVKLSCNQPTALDRRPVWSV